MKGANRGNDNARARGPSALAWTGWAAAAGIAIFMGVLLRNANIRANDAMTTADNAKSDSRLLEQVLLTAGNNSTQLKTRLTSLEQKVKDLNTDHDKLLVAMAESKQQFMADIDKLMHADQFALTSKEMPGVTGTLFWNRAEGTWTVMGSNIKMPAAGKTLELWIITAKGEKIAAGTFMPDASGRARCTRQKSPPTWDPSPSPPSRMNPWVAMPSPPEPSNS